MSKLDWAKDRRDHPYVPSVLAQPATQRQLDYILGLAHRKDQRVREMPKTKRGAGELIDRLDVLPDINEPVWFRNGRPKSAAFGTPGSEEAPTNSRQELVVELRECFPQLTPMTVNSLVQLFSQVDELGMLFTLDSLMHDAAPEDPADLIIHILRRLLEEIAPVTGDDKALAA